MFGNESGFSCLPTIPYFKVWPPLSIRSVCVGGGTCGRGLFCFRFVDDVLGSFGARFRFLALGGEDLAPLSAGGGTDEVSCFDAPDVVEVVMVIPFAARRLFCHGLCALCHRHHERVGLSAQRAPLSLTRVHAANSVELLPPCPAGALMIFSEGAGLL